MDISNTPCPPDDAALLHAARRGDPVAFQQLYQRHAPAIHSLVLRLCGSVETAEDITQDVFLKAMRFLPGLRAELPLRPWLKRTASNALIDLYRRQWRALPLDDEEMTAGPGAPPDAGAEASGLLRRLPPAARTLVWLQVMEGWSHREIAARFGRSESWSKSVVSRALSQLRGDLEGLEENDG